MSDFKPIDHKESDPDYVARVRKNVALQIGCELLAIDSSDQLIGCWKSSLSRNRNKLFDVEFKSKGLLLQSSDPPEAKPGKWKVTSDSLTETTWVPPMPEYGIEEESWCQEAYRCARTADGRVVYWNGDGSLIVELTQVS